MRKLCFAHSERMGKCQRDNERRLSEWTALGMASEKWKANVKIEWAMKEWDGNKEHASGSWQQCNTFSLFHFFLAQNIARIGVEVVKIHSGLPLLRFLRLRLWFSFHRQFASLPMHRFCAVHASFILFLYLALPSKWFVHFKIHTVTFIIGLLLYACALCVRVRLALCARMPDAHKSMHKTIRVHVNFVGIDRKKEGKKWNWMQSFGVRPIWIKAKAPVATASQQDELYYSYSYAFTVHAIRIYTIHVYPDRTRCMVILLRLVPASQPTNTHTHIVPHVAQPHSDKERHTRIYIWVCGSYFSTFFFTPSNSAESVLLIWLIYFFCFSFLRISI